MQPIDVRVHDVEIFDPLRDRLEQSAACGCRIGGGPAEAECAGPNRMQLPTRAGVSAGDQAVRISAPVAYILLYTALYAAFGVASPFWPRFFETRGLSPQEIGIVLAAAMVTRLLAGPTVGMLADRAGSLRFALAVCAALAAAWAAALLWVHSFALLLFVAVLQAASLAPTTSLADALSVNAARPRLAGKEFEYGWIRGSASLAFIFGTLTAGQLISRTDVTPIIWMNLSFLVVAAASTALLPPVAPLFTTTHPRIFCDRRAR